MNFEIKVSCLQASLEQGTFSHVAWDFLRETLRSSIPGRGGAGLGEVLLPGVEPMSNPVATPRVPSQPDCP